MEKLYHLSFFIDKDWFMYYVGLLIKRAKPFISSETESCYVTTMTQKKLSVALKSALNQCQTVTIYI